MDSKKDKIIKVGNISTLDYLEKITKANRSKSVKEHDYGRIKTANAEPRDMPLYAILEYDKSGQLVYEDYSKLEEYIEKTLIPNNIKETRIRNPKTNLPSIEKTIQGNVLTKLRLSEKEIQYTLDYLSKKGILVRGTDSSLDDDIEGYQYISTYKTQNLPEAFSMIKNFEIFTEYNKVREAVKKLPKDSPEKAKMEKQIILIRNKLVEGNMRLVYDLIRKRIKVLPKGMSEDDLYQIGNEILINFIENYDIERGALSTYVYNYLTYHIQKHFDEYKEIYIPSYMKDRINRILKVQKLIEQKTRRKATEEEIADRLDLTADQVKECLETVKLFEIESYDEYRENKQEEEQYKGFTDDIDDLEYDEIESKTHVNSAETEVLYNSKQVGLPGIINDLLDTLTELEASVLKLRFGLFNGKTYTIDEVSKILNITRDIVRNTEERAIKKLRHPSRSKQIRNYYTDYNEEIHHVKTNGRH